jgi:hypothetical protein
MIGHKLGSYVLAALLLGCSILQAGCASTPRVSETTRNPTTADSARLAPTPDAEAASKGFASKEEYEAARRGFAPGWWQTDALQNGDVMGAGGGAQ